MEFPEPDDSLIATPGRAKRSTGWLDLNGVRLEPMHASFTGDRLAKVPPPLPWWKRWWRKVTRRG